MRWGLIILEYGATQLHGRAWPRLGGECPAHRMIGQRIPSEGMTEAGASRLDEVEAALLCLGETWRPEPLAPAARSAAAEGGTRWLNPSTLNAKVRKWRTVGHVTCGLLASSGPVSRSRSSPGGRGLHRKGGAGRMWISAMATSARRIVRGSGSSPLRAARLGVTPRRSPPGPDWLPPRFPPSRSQRGWWSWSPR
jgi:hypothetical protein